MQRYIETCGDVIHTSSALVCKIEGVASGHVRRYEAAACPVCHDYVAWRHGVAPSTPTTEQPWGGESGQWT